MATLLINARILRRSLLALAAMATTAHAAAARDVVLAIGGQPETLDPYNTTVTLTTAVTKSVYEGLFQFDKQLLIKNALAEGFEVSKDGRTYTLRLRRNVKFHDGTDFNAEAVKLNLERAANPDNRLARNNQFSRIAKVEALDPATVRITLKEPFGPFINTLAHPSAAMISPAALRKWGKDIGFHPVGTGPYEFVDWKQTDHVRFKRFAGYWNAAVAPGVESLTWKPVLDNNTRAAMLQTGETDFAFPLPYEQAELLGNNPKLDIVRARSIVLRYLSFNMLQKPFDDLRVRQAINHAINREALAKVAFNGYAMPADGIVPQGVKYAARQTPLAYDPKKARALLAQAGYPNGFESVLWSAYTTTTAQKAIQFIQQQLAQVGIKVSVQALEVGQRTEWVNAAPDPKTARVRMYYTGWSSSTGEADWALRPLLASEAWPPRLNNSAYYKNDAVDAGIARALVSPDEQERAAIYKDVQDRIWADAPWAPLVTEQNLYARSKRLSGVYVMPDGNVDISEIGLKD